MQKVYTECNVLKRPEDNVIWRNDNPKLDENLQTALLTIVTKFIHEAGIEYPKHLLIYTVMYHFHSKERRLSKTVKNFCVIFIKKKCMF